jgi:hypothetical protein
MAAKKKVVKKSGRPLLNGRRGLQVTLYFDRGQYEWLQEHSTPSKSVSKMIREAVASHFKVQAA